MFPHRFFPNSVFSFGEMDTDKKLRVNFMPSKEMKKNRTVELQDDSDNFSSDIFEAELTRTKRNEQSAILPIVGEKSISVLSSKIFNLSVVHREEKKLLKK